MSRMEVTRRRFLSRTAVAAGAVIAGPSLFNMDELFAQATWVRPDVATASASILTSYRAGIAAMQLLPVTDPRSWAYQAAIHGTFMTPVQPAWNTCQHGSFFFVSWHRMYLYWFEQIVRTMSGNCGWALPYWNYKPLPAGNTLADATASRRILPGAIALIAGYYLIAGLLAIALAAPTHALWPWTMGILFGVGQLACAGILYWTLERNDHGRPIETGCE